MNIKEVNGSFLNFVSDFLYYFVDIIKYLQNAPPFPAGKSGQQINLFQNKIIQLLMIPIFFGYMLFMNTFKGVIIMKNSSAYVYQFGFYRFEEFNYRSSRGMLDKFVKIYYKDTSIDITFIVAEVIQRKLSSDRRCFGSFYNLNCYGFYLYDNIRRNIQQKDEEANRAVLDFIYILKASL